jgi:hypothetical protein
MVIWLVIALVVVVVVVGLISQNAREALIKEQLTVGITIQTLKDTLQLLPIFL